MARHYTLSPELIAAHAGGPVVALAPDAAGRTFRAYSRRPGPERNRDASAILADLRADSDAMRVVRAEPEAPPADVLVVEIMGPIEQRSGQHEPSGSWVDGHDAICERFAAAFEVGDVVCIGDTPGGSVAGGPEHIRRALEMKAKHGRRCIGFTEAGCFSMGLWWMMALCDEIYVSRDGRLGSVGARGMLASMTGALARDGVVVEIVEDPDGKACGSPEREIDNEARARAQRDVTAAADMFRAALCESPVGKRHGLTPEALKGYRGDVFQGQAAVTRGLADGVETLENVLTYALATAGSGGAAMADPTEDPKPNGGRAEDDDPKDHDEAKCGKCQKALAEEERYCGRCGTDRVPPDAENEDPKPDAEDDEEKPPPSSQRRPPGHEEGRKATAASRYAGLSVPALRTAAIAMHGTLDAVARLVGARSHAEIIGATEATKRDATKAVRYRAERDEQRKANDARERLDILHALSAADPKGHPRGKLLVDVIENDKITGVRPAKLWSDGPEGRTLPNLRGYARNVLDAMPAAERNPFDRAPADADPKAAITQADEPTAGEIEAAKRDPAVVIAARTTPGAKIDDLARAHVLASRAARRAQVPA